LPRFSSESPAYPPGDLQRDPPEDWYADVGLPRITARYLWWGLSANTRRTYTTARNSYRTFAAFSGLDSPFPVTVESLCNWMAYLGNRGRTKSATMKSYLTGLRSYCVDMGMYDLEVFRHPRLQRVIRGIKIFHGAREGDCHGARRIKVRMLGYGCGAHCARVYLLLARLFSLVAYLFGSLISLGRLSLWFDYLLG
jgi:hypothetical protein